MAKFLNTSATNYFLEELIKDAKERLILISPSSSSMHGMQIRRRLATTRY
ncbi:hypothetical protein ACSZOJ_19170 [Aeromonas dhakensis]